MPTRGAGAGVRPGMHARHRAGAGGPSCCSARPMPGAMPRRCTRWPHVALGFTPGGGLARRPARMPPGVACGWRCRPACAISAACRRCWQRLRAGAGAAGPPGADGQRAHRAGCGAAGGLARRPGAGPAQQTEPHGAAGPARRCAAAAAGRRPRARAALQGMGLHTLADLRRAAARRPGAALRHRAAGRHSTAPAAMRPEPHAWLTLPPRFDSRLELMCRADTSAQLLARRRGAAGPAGGLGRGAAGAHRPLHAGDAPRARRRHARRRRQPPERTALQIALAEPSLRCRPPATACWPSGWAALPLAAPALELSLRCEQPGRRRAAERRAVRQPAPAEREGLVRLVERLQARLGAEQVQRLRAGGRPPARVRAPAGRRSIRPGCAADPPAAGRRSGRRRRSLTPSRCGCCRSRSRWPSRRAAAAGRPAAATAGRPRAHRDRLVGRRRPAVRDYFIAQAASGALVWVYRHRLPVDGRPGPAGSCRGCLPDLAGRAQ